LVEIDTVAEVSSRLVVNPARLKLDGDRLAQLIDALERAVS
jgi:ATP phosphoribosyltransferase